MRRTVGFTLIIAVLVFSSFACAASVTNLRCEYRVNPIGIDQARPRLSWVIESDKRGEMQTAYQVLVAGSMAELEADKKGTAWDSGKIESNANIQVEYTGSALESNKRYFWKVRVWDKDGQVGDYSRAATWTMGLLNAEDWQGIWINDGKAVPERDEDFYKDRPNPLFRKEFEVAKPVKRAVMHISGLGYYEASINGEKVGDSVLDPGWVSYKARVLYSSYDVTEMLSEGDNAIGAALGSGWYDPLPIRLFSKWNLRKILTIGKPRLILQMNIEYDDGTSESVFTDESWKTGEGPLLLNNVYLGERYDARLEQPGWDKVSFDDSAWKQAKEATEPIGELRCQMQPPIRITRTLKPVRVTEPKPGIYVVDFGQNFAGWIRMKVNGEAGTKVVLRYGELLHDDGQVNGLTTVACQLKEMWGADGGPGAPKTAWQEDTYILKGSGEETFQHSFTFHGFRYVQVTGYPGRVAKESFEGLRLNSDFERAGKFECSNEMFNKIQEVTDWTMLSNVFSIESDCPGREKFGYGGDMVTAGEAYIYNFDMANFYAKTVRDFGDDVRPNGGLPECAPYNEIDSEGLGGKSGPIGWQYAHPFLQQKLYQFYGDKRLIAEQYAITKGAMDFIRSAAKDNMIEKGISDHVSIDEKPVKLTSTAFYYDFAKLTSQFAQILGKDTDAQKYAGLAERIKKTFIEEFLEAGTGKFEKGTQICQSFALYYDLLPEEEKAAAMKRLANEITIRHKGHLSTGIFGTKMMFDVLREYDRADLAYKMTNQRTEPGFGYMLRRGATTLWESWGYDDNGPSHNHPMFGSVSEWFYRSLGGINPADDAVGFDKIVVRPQVVGDLQWVRASYDSIRGAIVSEWKREGDTLKLDVTIPANTTATVYVPTKDASSVREGGKSALEAECVKLVRTETGAAVYEVGSGKYSFVSKF